MAQRSEDGVGKTSGVSRRLERALAVWTRSAISIQASSRDDGCINRPDTRKHLNPRNHATQKNLLHPTGRPHWDTSARTSISSCRGTSKPERPRDIAYTALRDVCGYRVHQRRGWHIDNSMIIGGRKPDVATARTQGFQGFRKAHPHDVAGEGHAFSSDYARIKLPASTPDRVNSSGREGINVCSECWDERQAEVWMHMIIGVAIIPGPTRDYVK